MMDPLTPIEWSYFIYWAWNIGFAIFIVYIIHWLAYGRFYGLKELGIPGPPPTPFVGCMADLWRKDFKLQLLLDSYRQTYGKVYGMYLQSYLTVVISDPQLAKRILVQDFSYFHDRKPPFQLPQPYDSFISVVEGRKWRQIRDALSPAFSPAKIRNTKGTINEVVNTLESNVDKYAECKKTVDINKFAYRFALDAIVALAFGINCEAQTDPDNIFVEKAHSALQEPIWVKVATQLPFSYYYLKYIPWAFTNRYDPLAVALRPIIRERRLSNGHVRKQDLLSLLLEAQQESNKEETFLTDDELVVQAILFLIAGSETTATAIATIFYHLALYPDIQQKLYQEVHNVMQKCFTSLDSDDVSKCDYLEDVINESLRLYPPVYFQFRSCTKDCTIQDYCFKKDTNFFISTYSIQRDPELWKEPTKFNPDRFRDKASIVPYSFMPFGSGPRGCMGKRLAMLEMKIAIARIIYRYEVLKTEQTPVELNFTAQATMTVSHPIDIQFRRRPSKNAV